MGWIGTIHDRERGKKIRTKKKERIGGRVAFLNKRALFFILTKHTHAHTHKTQRESAKRKKKERG